MKHLLSILLLLSGCTAAVEPTPEPVVRPAWWTWEWPIAAEMPDPEPLVLAEWPPEGGMRYVQWQDGSDCPYPPESSVDALPIGDANHDLLVTIDDLASVQQHLGDYGPAGIYGDANWDGVVTDADTDCVRQKMGRSYGEPVVAAVPEEELIVRDD